MCLSFQKLFYPPLYWRLSEFSLMLRGMVLLPIIPKIAVRLNILFLPPAQRMELYAIVMVLRDFPQQPINLYHDSHYMVGDLCHIETPYVSHTSSEEIFSLFFQLHSLVITCLYPCFVSHLCSHSNLLIPLTDSNAQADKLVSGFAHTNCHIHRRCPTKSCCVPSKCFSLT
jgi:hypothetical protein